MTHIMHVHGLGVTRSCGLIGISRSLYHYESRRPDDEGLRQRLCELAAIKRRYGYRRLHVLMQREGWQVNRKKLLRVYRQAGLSVRRRKRKRIAGVERQLKVQATMPNQSWSMDFVSDGLADGRRLRCLNIVDDFTKELRAQESWLGSELMREIQDYDLIVVGYSGRDQSLMSVLAQAYSTSERRLYWCGFGDEPAEEVKTLLHSIPEEKQSAFYIDSEGFDDLMSRLAMRQLSGEDLARAHALIASTGEGGVRKMAFSVPPLPISHLIKSNAHPLRYPSSALKMSLVMPEHGSWKDWLREQSPKEAGPTVVFDKGALCLCDVPLAQRLFAEHLNGPVTEVAISDENLISDGRILGLYRRALIIAAAKATGMKSDGRRRIWETAPYDQKIVDRVNYKVHRALSIDIVGVNGRPHAVFMPEIVASTLDGKIADLEPTKALRNQIYGYQHNNVFDADLSRWAGQLVNVDLPSLHGGIFHIARAPLFAGLSNKAAKPIPSDFSRFAKQAGIVVPDAPLIFASKIGRHEIKNPNPLHGLVENRPWDHSLTSSGLCPSTEVAVICPENLAASFEQFLHVLEQPANPSQSERDYLHDYPGYTAAFGLPLRAPRRGEGTWLSIDDNVSNDALAGSKQLAQKICQTLDLIRRARQTVTVVIYVPRRWEPYKVVSTSHESFNLHDYVKAYAARHGQSTQFVREETTSSSSQCRVRWWLPPRHPPLILWNLM
ncbi:hypothetical protein C798_13000 [Herbaspirillum rubrisubalbicans Os34]|uniref:HTH-like domain-containing protein n=2 Tax=Pseudomonadati TaxID=3379134 RepID=A0A6M3ZRB6_9BURK|nr:IS3 family transposase [Herbaspirillum rubrisubalbicans]QJQ01118.1 hypothetical protein C798_13000 [Herbaspirillum rubrisubalbicans Os34]